jgi:tRNA(His) guanylyltransferase
MEAYNYFLWRERDATKNSITMAASSVYSHKELDKKNSTEKQEMLFKKGINWNNYPDFFKRGTYVKRVRRFTKMTLDELSLLPPNHDALKDPNFSVMRYSVEKMDCPPITQWTNKLGFLFDHVDEVPKVLAPKEYHVLHMTNPSCDNT